MTKVIGDFEGCAVYLDDDMKRVRALFDHGTPLL